MEISLAGPAAPPATAACAPLGEGPGIRTDADAVGRGFEPTGEFVCCVIGDSTAAKGLAIRRDGLESAVELCPEGSLVRLSTGSGFIGILAGEFTAPPAEASDFDLAVPVGKVPTAPDL